MNPEDIQVGHSYACRFRTQTLVDTLGRPAPNLSDTPVKGIDLYEGFGVITRRDTAQRLLEIEDQASGKLFAVSWDDVWDIDTVEWQEPIAP